MDFKPIEKVTITCPYCDAGLELNIAVNDNNAMQKLLTASDSFACPICKEKFENAHSLLNDVNTYNASLKLFAAYSAFKVKFE